MNTPATKPLRRADRRHAVHRRCRSPRPAGVDRLHARRAGRSALRQPAQQAAPAAGRDPRLPGARCRVGLRQEPLDRHVVDHGRTARNNYALLAPDKKTFVDLVTEGQPPAPEYFVYDAVLNRKDRELLDETARPQLLDLAASNASCRRRADRRRTRRRRLRARSPDRIDQRRAQRPLRRVRRLGRAHRCRHRARRRRRLRARSQEPARPNRVRPGRRLPRTPACGHGQNPDRCSGRHA